jgi:hypothetical protein
MKSKLNEYSIEAEESQHYKEDQEYQELDAEEIRKKIQSFGQMAQSAAEAIGERLVGPIQAGLIPMVSVGDHTGRVLVAVLPTKPGETIGGEGDPFAEALKAFKEALKNYGQIVDIGV